MEQTAQALGSAGPSGFAGLLASLAQPQQKAATNEATWTDDGLNDDVVTLSYEQALKNHARYRTEERGGWAGAAAAKTEDAGKPAPADAAGAQREGAQDSSLEKVPVRPFAQRELRSASVTIRMSQAECAQLRRRAAEAGLSMSAFLRSCVLEVDALRAQVKQTLAELRAGTATESAAAPARRPWWKWLRRIGNHKE
jgi:predicted DNA binding CopG/RHH family protein